MAACRNYVYPPNDNDLPLEDEDAITEAPLLDPSNGESDQSPANGDDTRPLLGQEPESSPVMTVPDHTQDRHHGVQPDVAVSPSPEAQLPLTPPPTPANVGATGPRSSESQSESGQSQPASAQGSSRASPDSITSRAEAGATRHASGLVNPLEAELHPGSAPDTESTRSGVLAALLRRRLSRQAAGRSQDDRVLSSTPDSASRAALRNRFINPAIFIHRRLFASQGPREDNDVAGASAAVGSAGAITALNPVPVSSQITTSPPKGLDVEDVVETVRGIQAGRSLYNAVNRIWKNALNGLVNIDTGEIVFGLAPRRKLRKKPAQPQPGDLEPNEASAGNQEAIQQQEESPSGLIPQVVARTAVSGGVDRTAAPTLASERDDQQPGRTGSAELSRSTAIARTTPPAEGSSPERSGSSSGASANLQEGHITFAPEPSREEAARASPNVVLPPTPASSPTPDDDVESAPRAPSLAVTGQTKDHGLGQRLRGRVQRFTRRFRIRRA